MIRRKVHIALVLTLLAFCFFPSFSFSMVCRLHATSLDMQPQRDAGSLACDASKLGVDELTVRWFNEISRGEVKLTSLDFCIVNSRTVNCKFVNWYLGIIQTSMYLA